MGEGLNDTVTVLCVDSVNNKLIAGGLFTETGLGQPAIVLESAFEGGRGMIDVSQLPHGFYFVNVNGWYAKIVKE